jgi:ribulose kinase
MIGAVQLLKRNQPFIAGTSSCYMAVSQEPRFIPGVWGPYFSAMVPGLWLTEAGQSATGALLDHVIYTHQGYTEAKELADKAGLSIFDFLNHGQPRVQCLSRERFTGFHRSQYTQPTGMSVNNRGAHGRAGTKPEFFSR